MKYTEKNIICKHCNGKVTPHCCGKKIIYWCDNCGSNDSIKPPNVVFELNLTTN